LDLAYYPGLVYVRRTGVIGDKLTVGIAGALNYGHIHHLDGFFI
jgi:hypothetical protein